MFWPFKRKKPTEAAQPAASEQADLPVVDENGNPEDPILAALVNEAYRSGGMVVGNVDDEGNVTIERRA